MIAVAAVSTSLIKNNLKVLRESVESSRPSIVTDDGPAAQTSGAVDPTELLVLQTQVKGCLQAFDLIDFAESEWRSGVFTGTVEYDPGIDDLWEELYRNWLRLCESSLAAWVEDVERSGASVRGAEDLRRNMAEARGILTPDHEFFSGDALGELSEKAIEEYHRGETEPMDDLLTDDED